ncbi:MAG: hypothetical protein GY768_00420 [Planctomycetaceae bacterium]|nr:hypothetical protein [Planctomycetaceae bacterium]
MSQDSCNVVILTTGISGSSVLTGFLARAGYWTGFETVHKKTKYGSYQTHENAKLVELNKALFNAVNYTEDYTIEYSNEAVSKFKNAETLIELDKYQAFIEECDQQQPWVWKDPRLWLTLRFWLKLIRKDNLRVILLTRNPRQLWGSLLAKRQIVSLRTLLNYQSNVLSTSESLLEENSIPNTKICYEDLIVHPEPTIEKINLLLGTQLSVTDLKSVYSKDLYKQPRSQFDYLKSMAIYLRNYSDRIC